MAAAGHAIGNHTFHTYSMPLHTDETIRRELRMTTEAIEDAGVEMAKVQGKRLMRPPYGRRRPGTLRVLREEGYVPVIWSVTLWDWSKRVTTEKIMRKAEKQIQGGDVILLHDGCNESHGLGPQPLGRGDRPDPDAVEAAAGDRVRHHPRDDRGDRLRGAVRLFSLARLPAGGHGLQRVRPRADAAVVSGGHDVTVFSQDPHPERFDLGGAATVRPDVGGLLPVFVIDATRATGSSWCRT